VGIGFQRTSSPANPVTPFNFSIEKKIERNCYVFVAVFANSLVAGCGVLCLLWGNRAANRRVVEVSFMCSVGQWRCQRTPFQDKQGQLEQLARLVPPPLPRSTSPLYRQGGFVELCGAVMRSHDSSRQWTFELVEEYDECEE